MTSASFDVDVLRERFVEERSSYERLGEVVDRVLTLDAAARGIPCVITHRAKEVHSFVKKAMRKSYADAWAEIKDKAGVRVITPYEESLRKLEAVIEERFDVREREDKRGALDPQELDYLGIHYIVVLQASEAIAEGVAGRECEIQLHTQAQNLWALVAHGMVYKAPQDPPQDVRRSIYRLLALIELFDSEVTRGRERVLAQPGYQEATMLSELERHFLKLTARRSDPKLSRMVVEQLRDLYSEDDVAAFAEQIAGFVEENEEKLRFIFDSYLEDDRVPLVGQPEILLIFERLGADKYRLAERWAEAFPAVLLERVAEIWGTPFTE